MAKPAAKPKPRPTKRPAPVRASAARGLTLTARAEIRAADAAQPQAPRTFRLVANTGEPMRLWPYDSPVVVDLDTVDTSGLPLPALYDHIPDIDFAVGQVSAVAVQGGQLVADGVFTLTDQAGPAYDPGRDYARKVLAKADAKFVWQVSIGGDPKTVENVQAGQSAQVNGRTYAGPVAVARGVVLREISFVVLGADRRTSAVVARHRLKGSASMSFEEWLVSMGFVDPNALDDVQRANLKIMYDQQHPEGGEEVEAEGETEAEEVVEAEGEADEEAVEAEGETEAEEEAPPPTNARGKGVKLKSKGRRVKAAAGGATERARVTAILAICASEKNPRVKVNGQKVRLADHAIAAGWTVDRVKAQALTVKRNQRPSGPAIISRSHDKDCTVQALTGAMILRAGGKLDSKAYASPKALFLKLPAWLRAGINDAQRNQIMEASHRYADMSLVDLCAEAARIDGKSVGHGREAKIQAAFSGGSLSSVFTTNVNALLLTSYMETADTTVGWCTEADVADFKEQERPRVEVGPGLEKLARGNTAEHAAYSDVNESYKVARYAKQFAIDEQDMIDDSLGALSDIPTKFGQAAARLRPDLVYAILLSNPNLAAIGRALFHATQANTAAGAALSAAALRAAIAAMGLVQENGQTLNLTPTHLLVPWSLRFTAKELVTSTTIVIAGDAAAERGSANTLADEGLTIVADARLENGVTDPATRVTHAGSSTTWFLASVLAHLIEVGYLRGTGRAPRVRSGQLDKGQYGMWWDVSMDIGAKALDWKGFQRRQA